MRIKPENPGKARIFSFQDVHDSCIGVSGQHDDRNLALRMRALRAQPLHELRSIHARHVPVEQDDVRRECADRVKAADAVARLVDSGAAHYQQQGTDRLARMIFIVNDQDLGAADQGAAVSFSHASDSANATSKSPQRDYQNISSLEAGVADR